MKQPRIAVAAALLLAMTPSLAHASASGAPRMPIRIRATIEKFDQHLVTIRTDKGDRLNLELTPETSFATVASRHLADIKLNTYVGVTAIQGTDQKLHATRVYIFPETMRGAGEGHFPGREGRGSASINAAVAAIAPSADGATVTLHYKGKQIGQEDWTEIDVARDATIVAFVPADAGVLKPGVDTVTVVQKDSDGDLHALEIVAGKANLKPPM